MDFSCDPRGMMSWVFTLGEPADDVWEAFEGLLRAGYTDWIVIPIHNDQIHSLRQPDEVSIAL